MRHRLVARYAISAMFGVVGISHFTQTETLERIVPPYLPFHRELVLVSGAAEIAGAAAFALGGDKAQRWSGVWLIALLLAVFPANIQMALHPEQYPEVWGGRATLLVRLPAQLLLIWIVWFAMKSGSEPIASKHGTYAKAALD